MATAKASNFKIIFRSIFRRAENLIYLLKKNHFNVLHKYFPRTENGEINIGMIKYKIKHIGYSKISLLSMKKVDNVDDPLENERELWVYGCWLDCKFQIN